MGRDRLTEQSQQWCKVATTEAIAFYRDAGHNSGLIQPHLDTIYQCARGSMTNYFGGYVTDTRGGLD